MLVFACIKSVLKKRVCCGLSRRLADALDVQSTYIAIHLPGPVYVSSLILESYECVRCVWWYVVSFFYMLNSRNFDVVTLTNMGTLHMMYYLI